MRRNMQETLAVMRRGKTQEVRVERRKIKPHKFFRGAWELPQNREVDSGDWNRDVHDARLNGWRRACL